MQARAITSAIELRHAYLARSCTESTLGMAFPGDSR
jgi:hypothetical protein